MRTRTKALLLSILALTLAIPAMGCEADANVLHGAWAKAQFMKGDLVLAETHIQINWTTSAGGVVDSWLVGNGVWCNDLSNWDSEIHIVNQGFNHHTENRPLSDGWDAWCVVQEYGIGGGDPNWIQYVHVQLWAIGATGHHRISVGCFSDGSPHAADIWVRCDGGG